jgi:FlaA1/EpsC-like NDP-sugar epimerase
MQMEEGVIRTTGPEMIRFFFSVDEAVDLVITAFQNANTLHGKVLARQMKSAKIEDVLKIWIAEKGGRYEKVEKRPGERTEEYLIGELELPFTSQVNYNGIPHYIISFNQEVSNPLSKVISSGNAIRLTDSEILRMINNPPVEEL